MAGARKRAAPTPQHPPSDRAAPEPGAARASAPARRRGAGLVFGVLVACVIVIYVKSPPRHSDDSCDKAFDAGLKAIAAGDLVGARNQAARSSAACRGEAQSKAESLQAALNKAQASSENCQRNVRALARDLDEHKLLSARNGLDALDSECAATPALRPLRQQLAQLRKLADEVRGEARRQLDGRDDADAKRAIDKLEAIDREHPDLAVLKADLATLGRDGSEEILPPNTPLPEAPAAQRPPAAQPSGASAVQLAHVNGGAQNPPPAESGASMRAEMARGFLRDAERALGQRQFDAARTFLESARRADPNDPRADAIGRLIRERERQVLQQETTIK